MQVKTTAQRLLQAGLLNPTAPASWRLGPEAARRHGWQTKFFHLCGGNPMACLHASYCNADGPLD